jgi:hypothetical protein
MASPIIYGFYFNQLSIYYNITNRVIKERGYIHIQSDKDLKRYGLTENAPGLLIPCCSTRGRRFGYVYYPKKCDHQWRQVVCELSDRTPHNEWECSQRYMVDCSPICLGDLQYSDIPIYITETQRVSDSLISRGLCSISINDLWSLEDSKTEELDYVDLALKPINWQNREVRVVGNMDHFHDEYSRINPAIIREIVSSKGGFVFPIFFPKEIGIANYGYLEEKNRTRTIVRIPEREFSILEDLTFNENFEVMFLLFSAIGKIASHNYFSFELSKSKKSKYIFYFDQIVKETNKLAKETGDKLLKKLLSPQNYVILLNGIFGLINKDSQTEWVCSYEEIYSLLNDNYTYFPDERYR